MVHLQCRVDLLLGLIDLHAVGTAENRLEPDPILIGCLVEGMRLGCAQRGDRLRFLAHIVGLVIIHARIGGGVFDAQGTNRGGALPDGVSGELDLPAQVRSVRGEAVGDAGFNRLPVLPAIIGQVKVNLTGIQFHLDTQVGQADVAIHVVDGG